MSAPSAHDADELEPLEREARDLASRGPRTGPEWDTLVAKLQGQKEEFPPLDPDAARTSNAELLRLIQAIRRGPLLPEPPSTREGSRAGYAIEGEPGSQAARVRPAFAERLAAGGSLEHLQTEFSDLWAVDALLWKMLVSKQGGHSQIARRWLVSPGRRLTQDLSVLSRAVHQAHLGGSDFSWSVLCEAAGPLPEEPQATDPSFSEWRELHTAVPGRALAGWQPATSDVGEVLQILEGRRGDPVFLRGAALAWLLERAATNPFYDLNGIQRDLREDLVPALIAAFPETGRSMAEEPRGLESRVARLRAAARLESVALQHAARLVGDRSSSDALARIWSLARWIHSCTFRSPFFGGDEEVLAARLRALLPREVEKFSGGDDVLDPRRFHEAEDGFNLAELALVAGAVQHYRPDAMHLVLLPTPSPLIQELRRVAGRIVNAQEWEAEHLLAMSEPDVSVEPSTLASESAPTTSTQGHPGNALGWPAHHIAPPLVARWLMTQRNIAWIRHVSEDAWRESLRCFEEHPSRYEWVAFAIYGERDDLPTVLQQGAVSAWRSALASTGGELGYKGALPLMAAGVLGLLSEDEACLLIELAAKVRPHWRHHVLEALALAAERHKRMVLWCAALDGLLDMLRTEGLEMQERLRAALLALRRTSALDGSRPERSIYLERISAAVNHPPFSQHVGLRRELRRLGLSSAPDSRE